MPLLPKPWLVWFLLAAPVCAYLGTVLVRGEDRRLFLPGRTTDGHHQIEQACTACHTADPRQPGGTGVSDAACLKCHRQELEDAADSHPVKKFRDPRTAPLLERIDAMRCVTCHREHDAKVTGAMAVTQPRDYCAHCHQSIAADRPSHRGLSFATCASGGCHNFHDNRTLYESFLVRHAGEPDVLADPRVPVPEPPAPVAAAMDAPADRTFPPDVIADWAETQHARAGVGCRACHEVEDPASGGRVWRDAVAWPTCRGCHEGPADGFLAGRHGMRLAQGLPPMTPGEARLPMKHEVAHRGLDCVACHGAHRFDRRRAAVAACLGCHDDDHSRAYVDSPHAALWRTEQQGASEPGHGVSCATCHMPRVAVEAPGRRRVSVEHNQNANLRPNEKMVRTTCLQCHGLAFSLDAMADASLVARHFRGRPAEHVRSVDMAAERERTRRIQENPKEKR